MLQLLAIHLLAALVAPAIVSRLGRRGFLPLALVPAAAAVWAAAQTPQVLAGEYPTQTVTWVPALQLDLAFRLDTLSWLMTLIVGGVGALVLVACTAYFSAHASSLGRFAGLFVAFAGAMLGLVQTDNTLMLYVFWELTTVISFLLIGHYHDRQSSRRAAMQALVLTTFGGLAMLGGFVLLATAEGGSFRISELVAAAADGTLGGADPAALVPAAAAAVLLGAVTKSALVPFHFWLPAAMAAPTPVSAYLHAAAMVKAGVYLVARLAPGFAGHPALADLWQWSVVGLGLLTMLIGGYRALRQHDLKLVLAFGTVSQLGLITVLVGHGERAVALAGLALLLAHALFKAALFLAVAVVDWSVGTRDLRELSGLGRRMPVTAGAAALATISMAGLPPTIGYVAKEAALEALVHGGRTVDILTLVAIATGSALTLAYGLRFWWGAFWAKPGVDQAVPQRRSVYLVGPPVALALAGLVGLAPPVVEHYLAGYADTYPGEAGHLVLWGGVGVPLLTTVGVVVVGAALFVLRRPVEALQERVGGHDRAGAEGAYRMMIRGLEHFSADVTALSQRGSLPLYLAVVLVTAAAGEAVALTGAAFGAEVRPWDSPAQVLVVAVVAVAALLVTRARRRLKAVLLLGVVGYGIAVLFALHGAPDLALTQVLVETVTLVVFVLVLRRLPAYFSNRPLAGSRWWRAFLGVAVGAMVAVLGVVATDSRVHQTIAVDFPAEAYDYGYGKNIVNVTLVDIRAWDTVQEISVLLVAATGVAALVFLRIRADQLARNPDQPTERPLAPNREIVKELRREIALTPSGRPSGRGQTWLSTTRGLEPRRRSIILEVGARIVFPTLVVFSLFLLFAGHNAPGGGFAGGLVAGIALVVRYLAGGRHELAAAARLHSGYLLGTGLFLSAGAGAVPLPFGGTVLQSALVEVHLPVFSEVHLATALFFDIGVYLLVVGLVLDILRSLGGEVDRHGELEGKQAPDVAFDAPELVRDDAAPVEKEGQR